MPVQLAGRTVELSLDEVVAKYPEIPRQIAIKIDVQRRGVHYTERALSVVDPNIHQLRATELFGSRDASLTPLPESLLLADGTTILTDPTPVSSDPYHVDYRDGRLVLVDQDQIIAEVEYWPKPEFYNHVTSSGVPMNFVAIGRPQRLCISPASYCHFWKNDKGCRYCDIVPQFAQQKKEIGFYSKINPHDVSETVRQALKEPGRFTSICLTAGSNTQGAEPFDAEVDFYIELLQAIGENFKTPRFPSQLIATAFTEKQLIRLYENTGLMSYTADLEVLDEDLFNWICPGKAEWVGYREWKNRLKQAVAIFGRGNVNTGLVAGVELVPPYGYTDYDAALNHVLEEAEELAEIGVSTVYVVWVPRPGSYFRDHQNAPLEYYVRLALGLQAIRKKYQLTVDFDDYRRCGNHPDSDLARI